MASEIERNPDSIPDPRPIGKKQDFSQLTKPAALAGKSVEKIAGKPLSNRATSNPVESSTSLSEKPQEVQNIVLFTAEKRRFMKKTLREKKQRLKEKVLKKEDRFVSKIEKKLEEIPTDKVPKKSPSFFERKFGRALDWLAAWEFLFLAEHQVIENIQIEYAVGYEERLGEKMKNPNTTLFKFSNHQSISEIETKAKIAQKDAKIINKARGFDDTLLGKVKKIFKPQDEKNRFRGNVATYAKSLTPDGKPGQGSLAEQLAIRLRNKLTKKNLFMEPFVREVDEERFGLSTKDNRQLSRKLVYYAKNGFGFDYFTPGSVEESRFTDEEGTEKHRKGLQEPDCTQYFRFMELAEKLGKKPIIVFESMNGGYNVVDHTNRNKPSLTRKAIAACFDPRNSPGIRMILKVFHLENKPLMTAKVGLPMSKEEVLQQIRETYGEVNLKNLNNYVGHRLAELLPEGDARGVYA